MPSCVTAWQMSLSELSAETGVGVTGFASSAKAADDRSRPAAERAENRNVRMVYSPSLCVPGSVSASCKPANTTPRDRKRFRSHLVVSRETGLHRVLEQTLLLILPEPLLFLVADFVPFFLRMAR